jgi:hypothetical protein
MSEREKMLDRRRSEIADIECDGVPYIITAGRFPDGRVGEFFIDGPKVGSAAATMARDGAILCSLLLQHGVEPAKILRTLTKLKDGTPAGPIGKALALFAGEAL